MFKKATLAILIGAFSTGCSSIISESQYPVNFTSSPSGAEIIITNQSGVILHTGTTPETITLNAGDGFFKGAKYTINYKYEGLEKTTILDSGVDGWYLGNILFGGIIGLLIVDPATGAMFTLPEGMNTTFDVIEGNAALKVITTKQLTNEQKEHLVPL